MKKVCMLLSALLIFTALGAQADAPVMTPGTYTQTVMGHNGDFEVAVTVDETTITDIVIGENHETAYVGQGSMDKVRQEILKSNDPNADTISGATVSTAGLIYAVKQAVKEAGGDPAAMEKADAEREVFADTTTQVVVIGSGSAGLAATIEAHNLGLDVILIEQLGLIGGSSGRAGYYNGGSTVLTEASGDGYTTEVYIDTLVQSNPDQTELAQKLAELAGPSVQWLADMGVGMSYMGSGMHYGKDNEHIGWHMTEALEKQLLNLNIDYRLNTRAESIVMENGKAVGVAVSTKDGQSYTITADAVVLATGGYSGSKEMIAKYSDPIAFQVTDASKGADGSGMLMAESVGAQLVNMGDTIYMYPQMVVWRGTVKQFGLKGYGAIIVNKEGKRYTNEDMGYFAEEAAIAGAQKDGVSYLILTQNIMDNYVSPDFEMNYMLNNFVYSPQMYTRCDTLEDVEKTFGIPADTLAATFEAYNGYVKNGADPEFGRSAATMVETFEAGPYYLVETRPGGHLTYGGITTDLDMHVLNADGVIIPGLYAAGECTAVFLNGIGTNTVALTEGRIAAQTIAAEAGK